MSVFADLMAQTGVPALRAAFGDEATYTPPGTSPTDVATWAMVQMGSEMVGQYGDILEPRLTAQLPKVDVARPAIGAILTIDTVTYRIDQQLTEDDLFVTVAIRAVTIEEEEPEPTP
ncbi:MAG: hypothetical protein MUC53_00095 [Candidatus Contendobacter sp.]|jgi:hypothetical protein|nr:hypothetical protein [Candidatus Contendobacter sp.]